MNTPQLLLDVFDACEAQSRNGLIRALAQLLEQVATGDGEIPKMPGHIIDQYALHAGLDDG